MKEMHHDITMVPLLDVFLQVESNAFRENKLPVRHFHEFSKI